MAKEVDLSSKQWLDIVFDGKNKDFGAYEMRRTSTSRHNKAVIYSLIGLLIAGLLTFSVVQVNNYIDEQRRLQAENEQKEFEAQMNEQEDEKVEDIKQPEKEPEKIIEEVQSQKVTELLITARLWGQRDLALSLGSVTCQLQPSSF